MSDSKQSDLSVPRYYERTKDKAGKQVTNVQWLTSQRARGVI